MKIKTTRFGEVNFLDEHLINFKDGMVGFPKLKKYMLIESPSMPLILWLQSLDAPDIAFPLIEPWFFKRDYKVGLSEADKFSLQYQDGDKIKNLVVLTIPEDMTKMTVNLKAPVMIDITKASAAQIISQDKQFEIRMPAHEAFSKAISNYTIEQSTAEEENESWNAVDVRKRIESAQGL